MQDIKVTIVVLVIALIAGAAAADEIPRPQAPQIAPASQEGQRALAGFKVPANLTGQLFAAEPLVANPVAFCVDHQGRVYVCETFRQKKGVEDNRDHGEWLDEDLAAQTVDDRRAYIKKHLREKALDYAQQDDRIRLLFDANDDGRADKATVLADGFNDIVSGTGAGVLAHDGNVYYTCIPDLWRLRDFSGDGKADQRKVLLSGFGVRFAFRGHDLHGLIVGPDGRLYFSVGDRGYNIVADGNRWINPESGAVFRCELDGSNFEVVHTGLRNPQELAFDDYGNLFTGDNNSDSGDKARWVYVVEGGDSGWRMAYQYLADRGPFNREKVWHPHHVGQPVYIVPPVANIADGPSGLAYYPGTGLSDEYKGRFFLCDFRGGAVNSGVRSFRVRPEGAFFDLVDQEQPFWNILATDLAFGPDGALYISDWVHGWDGLGKGRIYRFIDREKANTPQVREVKRLLDSGAGDLSAKQLAANLRHRDQRIRLQAQFALVERKKYNELNQTARGGPSQLARLHAIWGLAQLARRSGETDPSEATFVDLLEGDDAEVRAQAVRGLGEVLALAKDSKFTASRKQALIEKLYDNHPRVRYFAAMAIGKVGPNTEAVQPLLELLAENKSADPILRHGGVMGLVGAADAKTLAEAATHRSADARAGVLIAMRKRKDPNVATFLNDAEEQLIVEAARAIHDVPIKDAMAELAKRIEHATDSEPLIRRVLNANYRLGKEQHARALANYAAVVDAPSAMRIEALKMLGEWAQPSPRDRVLGMWRPLPSRDPMFAANAIRDQLPGLLEAPSAVRIEGVQVAAKLGVREAGPALHQLLKDAKQPGKVRRDALLSLSSLGDKQLALAVEQALSDRDPLVRSAGRTVLAKIDPPAAVDSLREALDRGEVWERQQALTTLASLDTPGAEQTIIAAMQNLIAGEIPADAQLDVLEAARRRDSPPLRRLLAQYQASLPKDDPLAAYRETLVGGDGEKGSQVFYARGDLSCVRCHKVGEVGGEVGPNLSKIATDKKREYLLEALVLPNRSIAKGFESLVVITDDGKIHNGIVKMENERSLQLMDAQGQLITLNKTTIDERLPGKSSMPEDLTKHLSRRDLRDLVEFLSGLK